MSVKTASLKAGKGTDHTGRTSLDGARASQIRDPLMGAELPHEGPWLRAQVV